MRIAAKIAFSILTLTALGFCVAFVMEEIWRRANEPAVLESSEAPVVVAEIVPVSGDLEKSGSEWRELLAEAAVNEEDFADRVLREGELAGGLMLEVALGDLTSEELESHFMELMARDLDDYRAVDYAGRVLQEIAQRSPQLGVTLLSAMTPAEKEKLVPSVARGWTLLDPEGAFAWIDSAWVEADGAYIDRELQNALYSSAMDSLVGGLQNYELAASMLGGLVDPELKEELTEMVAHRIVLDGPEKALDRLADLETGVLDRSVMDAVAEQWAARDGVGAAEWVLANEAEMSRLGVRSIAKQLTIGAATESLAGFHAGLGEVQKRDTVASEAARLMARREPVASADWVAVIESPLVRRRAVFDALYEIGYEDFASSLNYIEYVYSPEDVERSPVVYSTLKDWLAVDLDAVTGYLGSGKANLSEGLSEELWREIEKDPQG